MIEKIIKRINLYKNAYKINNLKIVMTQEIYDSLIKDNPITEQAFTINNVPIEINDKIAIDFYVTEKLD